MSLVFRVVSLVAVPPWKASLIWGLLQVSLYTVTISGLTDILSTSYLGPVVKSDHVAIYGRLKIMEKF